MASDESRAKAWEDNPKYTWRELALQRAMWNGDYAGVDTLLEMGADPTISPRASGERGEWSLMHQLTYPDNYEKLEYLLKKGYSPNCYTEYDKMTPLHKFAYYWRSGGVVYEREELKKMARLLLKYGADTDAKDIHGRTPADVAAQMLAELQDRLNYQQFIVNVLKGENKDGEL